MEFNLTILFEQDEEGWWVAEIPEIPGACSQGKTIDEARSMVLDAANELTLARRERALKEGHPSQTETVRLAG